VTAFNERNHNVQVLLPVNSTMLSEDEEPGHVIHLGSVNEYLEREAKYAAKRAAAKQNKLVERPQSPPTQ
jgi:hypothetical protein